MYINFLRNNKDILSIVPMSYFFITKNLICAPLFKYPALFVINFKSRSIVHVHVPKGANDFLLHAQQLVLFFSFLLYVLLFKYRLFLKRRIVNFLILLKFPNFKICLTFSWKQVMLNCALGSLSYISFSREFLGISQRLCFFQAAFISL